MSPQSTSYFFEYVANALYNYMDYSNLAVCSAFLETF